MTAITVTIKGEDSTFKKNFLIYDEFQWSQDDPFIKASIAAALEDAKIEPDSIKIRSTIEVC